MSKIYNPQNAGTIPLGQSQDEETKLTESINGNRWFIWGWAVLNVGAAFVFPLAIGGGLGEAVFGTVFTAFAFGVPAFLLFRNQGFYSACMLFALAIINAIGGGVMAASGEVGLNFGSGIVALGIIAGTAMIAMDAYKLRRLRKARA